MIHFVPPHNDKIRSKIKDIAGSAPRVACLKSGECAAASLSQPPVFAAFDASAHTLAMHIETGSLLYVVDIVDRSWAETHGEVIVRYIRASAAAMRFIHDARNRDEVLKADPDHLGALHLSAVAAFVSDRATDGGEAGKWRALEALEKLGEFGAWRVEARLQIERALQASNSLVRSRAAVVLGQLGPVARPAIPALNKLLADESQDVRDAAKEALRKIGNPPVTPQP